jgi:hypothetical protein
VAQLERTQPPGGLGLVPVGEAGEHLDVLAERSRAVKVLVLGHPQPTVDEPGPGREGVGQDRGGACHDHHILV